jgi:hypothetical protein
MDPQQGSVDGEAADAEECGEFGSLTTAAHSSGMLPWLNTTGSPSPRSRTSSCAPSVSTRNVRSDAISSLMPICMTGPS